jgi:hypothetical protein
VTQEVRIEAWGKDVGDFARSLRDELLPEVIQNLLGRSGAIVVSEMGRHVRRFFFGLFR